MYLTVGSKSPTRHKSLRVAYTRLEEAISETRTPEEEATAVCSDEGSPRAMASSSAATALSSCNLRRSISVERSTLSASRSLFCSPVSVNVTKMDSRVSVFPLRRILPKVQAKKQTFPSLKELLEESTKPVLVDFYATWCGPCQYMVPILEEVSAKLCDKIQVIKIDTEKYTSIANEYAIEALPTFIIFRDGKPCDRFEGALPMDQLIDRIEKALTVPT